MAICNECGGTNFNIMSGYYYCNECNTQSQQMGIKIIYTAVDIQDFKEEPPKKIKPKNIDKANRNKEISTYEEFNYILSGLINQLYTLNAKEEIKLTAVQLWASYLRKLEIAFFSIDGPKMPRLGHDYNYKDAKLFYNHQKNVTKVQKKRRRTISKKTTLRKKKKFLLESEYNSMASMTLASETIDNSSLSLSNTSSAHLKIEFSRSGRKYLKRKMCKKHLDKHASDFESSMKCHRFSKYEKLPQSARDTIIDKFKLFSIVYIALNMNNDKIQLGDIIRFAREEHIPFFDTNQYLPDNVIQNETTSKIRNQDLIRHYKMRSEIWNICMVLNINQLKTPNMFDLCERYIDELCLPKELNILVERLLVLCPPEMKLNNCHRKIPNYEARAMAYIIFVLKICFGLDDDRELHISKSAKYVNKKINKIDIQFPELFVWSNWVQYIEMRNIIIKQCHLPTNLNQINYKNRSENYTKLLTDHFNKFFIDDNYDIKKKSKHCAHLNSILNSLHPEENCSIDDKNNIKSEFFSPSLTPNKTYLNYLLNNKQENLFIPDYMKEKFDEKSIISFLNPNLLKQSFRSMNINLLVNELSLNINHVHFIKPFRYIPPRYKLNQLINTNINDTKWENNVFDKKLEENIVEDITKLNEHNVILRDILLKQEKDKFIKNINSEFKQKEEIKNKYYETLIYEKISNRNKLLIEGNEVEMDNKEILNEDNKVTIEPRRNLDENILLFDYDDDKADDFNNNDMNHQYKSTINFLISNNDYWLHLVHDNFLFPKDFLQIFDKLPKTYQWLIKQCSSIIENDPRELYIELLIIENYFTYVLQPITNVKNMLLFQDDAESTHRLKNDTQLMIKRLKDLY